MLFCSIFRKGKVKSSTPPPPELTGAKNGQKRIFQSSSNPLFPSKKKSHFPSSPRKKTSVSSFMFSKATSSASQARKMNKKKSKVKKQRLRIYLGVCCVCFDAILMQQARALTYTEGHTKVNARE